MFYLIKTVEKFSNVSNYSGYGIIISSKHLKIRILMLASTVFMKKLNKFAIYYVPKFMLRM